MRPIELLVLYLIIGGCVAAAQVRASRPGAALAVPLWPLFLPALLAPHASAAETRRLPEAWRGPIEGGAAALREALLSWEGLPDAAGCLAASEALLRRLGDLAVRLDDLERVLASPEHATDALAIAGSSEGTRALLRARQQNVERLRVLRDQTRADLEHALAAMADLSTRVHLARLGGDATTEVAAELARLAAAVDGGGEVARIVRRTG